MRRKGWRQLSWSREDRAELLTDLHLILQAQADIPLVRTASIATTAAAGAPRRSIISKGGRTTGIYNVDD